MKYFLMIVLGSLAPNAFAWQVAKDVDKMTDEKFIIFSQPSKNAVWAHKKASLFVQFNCTKDITTIGMVHPYLLGRKTVQFRFDKDTPRPFVSNNSSDGKTMVFGDPGSSEGNPEAILSLMKDHKTLVLQYDIITQAEEVAEFSLAGLADKINNPCKKK